jgi:hypothetical protein
MVGHRLMNYWLQYLEEAAEVFKETLHTPEFDARTVAEMRTQLRAGAPGRTPSRPLGASSTTP